MNTASYEFLLKPMKKCDVVTPSTYWKPRYTCVYIVPRLWSRAQTPPSSRKEKGSGITSPNPWVSSRNVEHPIKKGIYWNNAAARTTTSIVPLKVML